MSQSLRLDLAWAAGFYEGEGSVSACGGSRLILSVAQADPEPLAKFLRAVGMGAISGPYIGKSPLSRKPMYRYQTNGQAALACLRLLWPMLSIRRREQALQALIRWMFRPVNNRHGVARARGNKTAWSERLHGVREYSPPPIGTGEYEPELET